MDLLSYKDIVFIKSANFVMLYTGDFVLRYVSFLHILDSSHAALYSHLL